jgi:circadian clock protein KaiB
MQKMKARNSNKKTGRTWQFHVYISGKTPHGMSAIENLKKFCKQYLSNDYDIKVIDISIHPEEAEANNIIAIPTIFKVQPKPQQIFIGDFSDPELIVMKLGLQHHLTANA